MHKLNNIERKKHPKKIIICLETLSSGIVILIIISVINEDI
jgi:hypothetical protein